MEKLEDIVKFCFGRIIEMYRKFHTAEFKFKTFILCNIEDAMSVMYECLYS